PNVVHGDKFVYPPFFILVMTPFYLMLKDVRYANLTAQIASAFVIYLLARKSQWQKFEAILLSSLFLLFPRSFLVLEQSWAEMLIAFFIFLSVFLLISSKSVWGPLLAGLSITSKQFLLPLGPLYLRFFPIKKNYWIWFVVSATILPLGFYLLSPGPFLD